MRLAKRTCRPQLVTTTATTTQPAAAPSRLAYIDGLRGLAILMVLGRHYWMGIYSRQTPRWLDLLGLGYLGVHLFLILSGFCVAWIFVGSRPRELTLRQYLQARATRILPAYYIALALCLALSAGDLPGGWWLQLWTHLTMTHNVFPETVLAVNGVFWSLALEFQLYLTFPILLQAFRRYHPAAVLLSVLALQTAYRLLVARLWGTTDTGTFPFTYTWAVFGRVFEFALGIYVAILVGRGETERRFGGRPWLPVLLAGLSFAVALVARRKLGFTAPVTDLCWSLGFVWLLVAGTVSGGLVNAWLSWRPLVFVGTISYSIYLVHILPLHALIMLARGVAGGPMSLILLCLPILGATIGVCYLFHLVAEKPFLKRRKKVVGDVATLRKAA